MFCTNCGTQNPDDASFCRQCGRPLARSGAQSLWPGAVAPPQAPPTVADLASLGQRAGSFIIDWVLQAIPYAGLIPTLINSFLYRRGTTIGLSLVSVRIVRESGDVSGFYHTFVRAMAGVLSLLPLGLGYWWAFWDPMRQTWHDKMMHTYVLRDTPELRARKGSSSTTAVVVFWVIFGSLLVVLFLLILAVMVSLAPLF